jgi:dimethylargininase
MGSPANTGPRLPWVRWARTGGAALFKEAIVRKPGRNFAKGLTSFVGAPVNYELAVAQHDAYCAALEKCGLAVDRLEPDLAHPDSTFVEDVAIVTPNFAVITRPGAKTRAGEIERIREPLKKYFRTVHEIASPGTLDGGDICEAGSHFFIGVSRRTNEDGAKQLASFLAQGGYTSSFVDIRAMKSILHLKSGIACIGERQLVVMEEMVQREEFRKFEIISVAPAETYAANCVRVNGYVLIPEGFPEIAEKLSKRGFNLLPLEVSEFQKMDGGLSCLSLRF